jgi:ribonuclease VapC
VTVIDTSAMMAILHDEPERRAFVDAIETAETRSLSVASFLETSMIVESRFGAEGVRDLDLFIGKAEIQLVAVDAEQAHVARQAFRQFGKGRHAAGLNFGDCFSYALARVLFEPLLYKGDDFANCDIESHLASTGAAQTPTAGLVGSDPNP